MNGCDGLLLQYDSEREPEPISHAEITFPESDAQGVIPRIRN